MLLAATMSAPPAARCQGDEYAPPRAVVAENPRQRQPSIFHRAACATAEEQMTYVGDLLAQGRTGTAMRASLAVVYTWHDSIQAPKAQLTYAKLLYQTGHYRAAFDEFQYLNDFYQGLFPFDEVADFQFRIANHIRTEEHGGFLFLPSYTSSEKALPLFEQLLKNAPQAKHADEAQFHVGTIHEERKEYEEAVLAYEALRHKYPKSEFLAEADFRKARAQLAIARSMPRDEQSYRTAIAALSAFLRDHPAHAGAGEIRAGVDDLKDGLAKMYYDRALFYDRTGEKPRSAIIAYKDFLNNFPASPHAEAVRLRIGELEKGMGASE